MKKRPPIRTRTVQLAKGLSREEALKKALKNARLT